MAKKSKYKVHFGSSGGSYPKSACGTAYPVCQTYFIKHVDCKRCKATSEYYCKKEETQKKFMKGFDEIDKALKGK